MIQVRIHGRGGQGAITAAEVLATAAFKDGKYAQAFGKFGPERRGAPVESYVRISEEPISIMQHVYDPDIVVVLEPGLMDVIDVRAGMKGDKVILNTDTPCEGCVNIDANCIAMDAIGKAIVNTAMLGALIKVTGIATVDSVAEAIMERFPGPVGEKNVAAMKKTYEAVQ